jgi:enterochelin esterase-like enzyme
MLDDSLRRGWAAWCLGACLVGACGSPSGAPRGGAAGQGDGGTAGGGAGATATGAAGAASDGGGGAGPAGAVGTAGAPPGTAGAGGADAAAGNDAGNVPDPGAEGDGDFTIGPTYVSAPELTVAAGVPRGTVTHFTIASTESPIFPGVTGPYTREGWLYVPKQYVAGTAAPFIIAQDGRDFMTRLPAILDTMINAKRVPALLAVMVMAGPGDGPGSERGLEYDTVSDAFVRWVESTVLPKMEKTYNVKFTTDPEGRASLGGSSGATAAFTMAWFRPDLYRRVLSYSGTFVNQAPSTLYPHGAWEYPEHLVADTPMKPLRVYLEVGELDNGYTRAESTFHNWVIANQKLAAALLAKGYHYHFDFAKGGMHNDARVVNQTLPAALEWLWRGYPFTR